MTMKQLEIAENLDWWPDKVPHFSSTSLVTTKLLSMWLDLKKKIPVKKGITFMANNYKCLLGPIIYYSLLLCPLNDHKSALILEGNL